MTKIRNSNPGSALVANNSSGKKNNSKNKNIQAANNRSGQASFSAAFNMSPQQLDGMIKGYEKRIATIEQRTGSLRVIMVKYFVCLAGIFAYNKISMASCDRQLPRCQSHEASIACVEQYETCENQVSKITALFMILIMIRLFIPCRNANFIPFRLADIHHFFLKLVNLNLPALLSAKTDSQQAGETDENVPINININAQE